MPTFFEQLTELIDRNAPCVSVTVVDVIGSVPNERGAKMIVTREGLHSGTVGGGKIEKRAIEEAQRLISGELRQKTHFVQWNLNKDLGMTCGGSVKLYFEAFNSGTWEIVVFGGGHVAQALIATLLQLDCRITCFDSRPDWLSRLPPSPRLIAKLSDNLPSEVAGLPGEAFVILMTMGHTTDKPILLEILRTRRFPYLGVIGSEAKAVQLRKDVAAAGLPEELQRAFHCPIGLPIGTNHPQEIALSVAAQLLQERDRHQRLRAVG